MVGRARLARWHGDRCRHLKEAKRPKGQISVAFPWKMKLTYVLLFRLCKGRNSVSLLKVSLGEVNNDGVRKEGAASPQSVFSYTAHARPVFFFELAALSFFPRVPPSDPFFLEPCSAPPLVVFRVVVGKATMVVGIGGPACFRLTRVRRRSFSSCWIGAEVGDGDLVSSLIGRWNETVMEGPPRVPGAGSGLAPANRAFAQP